MANTNFIYVSNTATFFPFAQQLIVQYGWIVTGDSSLPWLVFDLFNEVAFYTRKSPPNNSSVLVAASISDVSNNLAATIVVPAPVVTGPPGIQTITYFFTAPDQYNNNITFI